MEWSMQFAYVHVCLIHILSQKVEVVIDDLKQAEHKFVCGCLKPAI